MKKILFTAFLGILSTSIFAQITDTGDKIGVGISTPNSKIHINTSTSEAIRVTRYGSNIFGYEIGGSTFGLYDYTNSEYKWRTVNGNVSLVESSGSVGIGTASPSSKLDIRNGHLYVGDEVFSNPGSWGQTINIDDNVHSRILIEERATGVKTSLWAHKGGNAKVGTISNHDFGIITNGTDKLTVKTNGYIGIGTTSPSAKLDVRNGGQQLTFLEGNNTSSYKLSIGVNDDGINFTNNSASRGFNFRNINGYLLKVSNKGNAALYGKFEAKEIKVTLTPTADFVFEENYDLPSLKSIEKHIKEKKHLPEIASAKEMEKSGVNVGNFQIQLLQKIEELTLYTIEQEKKIESLEKQQKEIEELKKQNSRIKDLEILVQKLLKAKN